jgi:hypothetical protein
MGVLLESVGPGSIALFLKKHSGGQVNEGGESTKKADYEREQGKWMQ